MPLDDSSLDGLATASSNLLCQTCGWDGMPKAFGVATGMGIGQQSVRCEVQFGNLAQCQTVRLIYNVYLFGPCKAESAGSLFYGTGFSSHALPRPPGTLSLHVHHHRDLLSFVSLRFICSCMCALCIAYVFILLPMQKWRHYSCSAVTVGKDNSALL